MVPGRPAHPVRLVSRGAAQGRSTLTAPASSRPGVPGPGGNTCVLPDNKRIALLRPRSASDDSASAIFIAGLYGHGLEAHHAVGHLRRQDRLLTRRSADRVLRPCVRRRRVLEHLHDAHRRHRRRPGDARHGRHGQQRPRFVVARQHQDRVRQQHGRRVPDLDDERGRHRGGTAHARRRGASRRWGAHS